MEHQQQLTHWGWDEIGAICKTIVSKLIFFYQNCCFLISLIFVPKGPIRYNLALVQLMACHQTGDKSSSEPMMVLSTDAYMCYSAQIN